jgi:hypothetical protein
MRKMFLCCLLSGVTAAGMTLWAVEYTMNSSHGSYGHAALTCSGVVPADCDPAGDSSTHDCVDLNSLCCQEQGEAPQLKGYEVTAEEPDGSKIVIPEGTNGPDVPVLSDPDWPVPLYSERPESTGFFYSGGFIFFKADQQNSGTEECEGPSHMPLVTEYNDAAPMFMPYIDDEAKSDAKCVFSFFMGLFSDKRTKVEPYEDCEPPDLTFDPNECREDPAYHHQYPGCPFTGACPTRPSMPYPKTSTPPRSTHDQDCDVPEPIKSKSFKPYTPNDMESLLRKTNDSRKHIDTTEYRPSDALPGERRTGLTPF